LMSLSLSLSSPTHSPSFSFSTTPPPPRSTLFPYTTLFRSHRNGPRLRRACHPLRAWQRDRRHRRGDDLRASRRRVASLRFRAERSEEHTSELQSLTNLVCRLLLEKKKKQSQKASKHVRRTA